MIRISEVDPADETTLRAFWETEQASVWADREHAIPRSWQRLVAMVSHPNDWYRRTLLVARDGDEVVGTADLGGSTTDNLHLADLEIHVRPERRRQGIGSTLDGEASQRLADDGRTSVCGEVYVPPGSSGEGVAAYAFAAAMGFEPVHTEDHLLLSLPVGAGEVERLRAKADATAYDVLTWSGPCPDEHLEPFCDMHTRMSTDVPVGDIDAQPVAVDAERLRAREQRVLRYQDDTLVMPEHRGHRLGTLLELATLELLQRDRPERVALHTDTAVDNHAMQATNRDFGFRPVERVYEMQRRDG